MAKVSSFQLEPSGGIPNHPAWPLLLYEGAFSVPVSPQSIAETFARNRWLGAWVNGVFDFHHFHSTAHEVLGCFQGMAEVQFGGSSGPVLTLAAGDAVAIPAGVGHRKIKASGGFGVVGAYPDGQDRDLCRERAQPEDLLDSIRMVARPACDPVSGEEGPLLQFWVDDSPSS